MPCCQSPWATANFPPMLDDRKSLVLQALVEEYIRTGEPVSSRTVLESSNLEVSSATVRNDLARLESYGFIEQPHTSSGRVPTHQGYRYYVDHCSPGRLRSATRARIEQFFSEVHQELARLLEDTSGLLTDLTHFPAVVVGPNVDDEVIHAIHLVRLGSSVVLVVTVAETGRVAQQVIDLGFDVDNPQLAEAEKVLERVFAGRALSDATGDDARLPAMSDVVRRVVAPVRDELAVIRDISDREIYVGGTSHLASLWNDLAIVHELLGILEEKAELREIVEAAKEGTSVRIGAELGEDLDMAVVSAPFGSGPGRGRIGVIGPMRMDYRRTIRVVEQVGENLGDSLESEE